MMNYAPFDELRPKLEKQYENVVYSTEDCWSEAELRQAWDAHKQDNPDEDRILSRSFLIAMILRHAPIGLEPFNPFPGKFQTFGLLQDDLEAGFRLAKAKVPGVICYAVDMTNGIGWMVDRSHVAPDWKKLFQLGLPGLIERVAPIYLFLPALRQRSRPAKSTPYGVWMQARGQRRRKACGVLSE